MKSGFVGILGRPNVGKSSLMNAIVGEKVAITSSKAQTTRNAIRGIYNEDGLQIVFVDTPGIHKPKNKLGVHLVETAMTTLREVDAVMFLVNDSPSRSPGDRYITEKLKQVPETPKILVINKMDLIEPERYKEIYDEYEAMNIFDSIIGTDAVKGVNADVCVEKLRPFIGEGPQYFPADLFTDNPMRFLVSEIIREKTLMYLNDEVPHGVAVEITRYSEEGRVTEIDATIYCERQTHKGIIIGAGGKKLKGIGKAARMDIEPLIGTKVFLQLWVKVKKNWRESEIDISNFGYNSSME